MGNFLSNKAVFRSTATWVGVVGLGVFLAHHFAERDAPVVIEPEDEHVESSVVIPAGKMPVEPRPTAPIYVLAPSKSGMTRYIAKGGKNLILYGTRLLKAGARESVLESPVTGEFTIPNTMIIPLDVEGRASKGDIVLTWWQSGSGIQRAFVTGGSETEPTVRYLDMEYDSRFQAKEETLKPGSFRRVDTPMEVGATVACKRDAREQYSRGIVTAVLGDTLQVSWFASQLTVVDRAKCRPVPIKPDLSLVKKGVAVWIPFIGSFREAIVDEVNEEVGRVMVSFAFGGQERKRGVAFTDIAFLSTK